MDNLHFEESRRQRLGFTQFLASLALVILIGTLAYRGLVPFFMLTILLASVALYGIGFYRLILFAQVAFYLSAIISYILHQKGQEMKLFYIPFYFCLVNIASAVGITRMILGERKPTWEKVETAR